MSQPASPIGSVEFIVKFDSMQSGFVNALKEAMKDLDLDAGADPQLTSKIDEILNNLRNRLRSMWTGNRKQFLTSAVADIEHNQDLQTIKSVAKDIIIGKKVIKEEDYKTPEEFQAKAESMAAKYLDNWSLMIQKAINDKAYWEKNKSFLITHQARIQAGLNLGRWPSGTLDAFRQIIREFSLEAKYKKIAKEEKFEISTQKHMAAIPFEIDITEGEGPKKKIVDFETLSDALSRRDIKKEELDKAMALKPGKGLEEYSRIKEVTEDMLKDYIIVKGSHLPNIFANTWKKMKEFKGKEWPMKGTYIPDYTYQLKNTQESIDKFLKVAEKAGSSKKEVDEIIAEVRQAFGLKKGEAFGTKVEGMEVEIKYEALGKEETQKLSEELEKLRLLKGISGTTFKQAHKLEREELDLMEKIKGLKVTIESAHQAFKTIIGDFKIIPDESTIKGLRKYGKHVRVTTEKQEGLMNVGEQLEEKSKLSKSAKENLRIEDILLMNKYGNMLKEALETKNVDLITAFKTMLEGLTPEQRSQILKK